MQIDVPVLEGPLVRLEPLAPRHADDLAAAAEEDRASYGFTLVPRAGEAGGYLDAQFARAGQGLIPFAQVRPSQLVVVCQDFHLAASCRYLAIAVRMVS
jgi:hypothetical protein